MIRVPTLYKCQKSKKKQKKNVGFQAVSHSTSTFSFKPYCVSNLECFLSSILLFYDYSIRYGICNVMGTYCHLLARVGTVILLGRNWLVVWDIWWQTYNVAQSLETCLSIYVCVSLEQWERDKARDELKETDFSVYVCVCVCERERERERERESMPMCVSLLSVLVGG